MHPAELAVTIFHGWLEFMAIAAAGLSTWGVKLDSRKLMLTGLVGTLAAQVIRSLPLRFGLHTILLMFVLLPTIYHFFRVPVITASCATFGGATMFLFVEEVVCLYILRVRGVHIEDMLRDLRMRAAFGFITPMALAVYTFIAVQIRRARDRRRGATPHTGA